MEPTEMRYGQVLNILLYFGYTMQNTRGSHYKFVDRQGKQLIICVHKNKVKRVYLQRIKYVVIKLMKRDL